jgi:Ca2+/Na+ antiporter
MLAHLGSAIYQNMGLVCILLIFLHKWFNQEPLDIANAFSLLALVFFTFVAVGNFSSYAIMNVFIFLAIIRRIAKVLSMEEHLESNLDNDNEQTDQNKDKEDLSMAKNS